MMTPHSARQLEDAHGPDSSAKTTNGLDTLKERPIGGPVSARQTDSRVVLRTALFAVVGLSGVIAVFTVFTVEFKRIGKNIAEQ